jgi:hypothetical protein
LQADGKIVIGGTFTNVNGTTRNGIAQLNADGSWMRASTQAPASAARAFMLLRFRPTIKF